MSDVIFIIGLFCVFALYILTRSSQMNDIEIVVFQDKSWVRLTEYQKLKDRYEALEETNEYQNDAICRLQKQIEKMKTCHNCKHSYHDRYHTLQCLRNCINFDKWEIAE